MKLLTLISFILLSQASLASSNIIAKSNLWGHKNTPSALGNIVITKEEGRDLFRAIITLGNRVEVVDMLLKSKFSNSSRYTQYEFEANNGSFIFNELEIGNRKGTWSLDKLRLFLIDKSQALFMVRSLGTPSPGGCPASGRFCL